jgi:hypothetical protein
MILNPLLVPDVIGKSVSNNFEVLSLANNLVVNFTALTKNAVIYGVLTLLATNCKVTLIFVVVRSSTIHNVYVL